MWSAYIFISLLCFKPSFEYPQSANQQLATTDKLDTKIEDDLKKSQLESDARNIKDNMVRGIGGTTIATYDGKTPRTFIFNNNTRNICKGTLKGMLCEGTVEPFNITVKEDYCYATSYATISNDICLSSRSVHLTFSNSKFVCKSGDGTPTLTLTRQEFHDLCNEVTSRRVVYKYYTNATDPKGVSIPNSNSYVKCLNSEPGVCEFEEDKAIPGGFIPSKGKDTTVLNKIPTTPATNKKGDNNNGSKALFQGIEVILFTVIVSFLFQY